MVWCQFCWWDCLLAELYASLAEHDVDHLYHIHRAVTAEMGPGVFHSNYSGLSLVLYLIMLCDAKRCLKLIKAAL